MNRMNEYDVDHAAEVLAERAPDVAPYAQYLKDFKDTINGCSDGWAYWSSGTRCAAKLEDLVERSLKALREHKPLPPKSEFDKALSPIKAAATRLKVFEAPTLNQGGAPSLRM